MKSTTYEIDGNNINIGATPQSSSSYDLTTTIGQTAAGEFSSTGYVIKAGFQYIYSIIPFSFTISDTSINFGTLTAQNPQTATSDLTVSFGAAGLYSVTATELGPMTTFDGGSSISDTNCNGGGQSCSEAAANVWNSTTTYGFGYNMSGEDEPADFTNSTYYRRFADANSSEAPIEVMANLNVTEDSSSSPRNTNTSVITYKVNVSSTQSAGNYQTIIRFVATPSF